MARHLAAPLLVLALASSLGPGAARAQEQPEDGVVVTNRAARTPAPPPELRAAKPPPALAADPFAWLRDAQAPAAAEWRAQERRQQERWLAVDPNYPSLLEEARRLPPDDEAPRIAAGRFFARDDEGAGWRSRRLEAAAGWRNEPALKDDRGGEAPRIVCAPRDGRFCLLLKATAPGLTLQAYDPATGRASSSPFAVQPGLRSAVLEGGGSLLTVSADGGTDVVRRERPVSTNPDGDAALFRASAGETVEPGAAVGAQGESVAWLTVRDPSGATSLWVEAEGAFRRLAAPPAATVVGVVGDQLVLLLRRGWPGAADLPAGALVGLDLQPLLKRAPELTPRRILSLADTPDVRDAAATAAGLLLVVHEGSADQLYLCQPGLRGWAVRKLAAPVADHWGVASVDATADAVVLRTRAFPQGVRFLQVDTRTGLASSPLPDRPALPGRSAETYEAAAIDQARIAYTVLRGDPAARTSPLPMLLVAAPRDQEEAEAVRVLGALWLSRGGDLAVAGKRSRRYDAENGYVQVLVGFEDLSSIGRDLVARGLAPRGRIALAGFRTGASLAALDVVKHPAQWSAAVLVDPVTDPLRAPADAADSGGAGWAALFAPARRPESRALWSRVAAYDDLRAGATYPPVLVAATPAAAPGHASDGARFAARLNEGGGNALFVEEGDSVRASATAVAFLLRLGR